MSILKESVEVKYKDQISLLISNDDDVKPYGWQMSPRSVLKFILGDKSLNINKKIYGNDKVVERSIVALATNRGLMLIGFPGTAKTMLSELLSAAICNNSLQTIQGSAATSESDLKYSWNYAKLIDEGPSLNSLIPSPVMRAMQNGNIVRFEEITRSPQEVQDMLISIMSDKVLSINEFKENNYIFANKGFNIIATANTLDKGVNEMSSALKRRFNIEVVKPVNNISLEKEIVKEQVLNLNEDLVIDDNVIDMLTTAFVELRNGFSIDGVKLEKPSKNLSTAELVNIYDECAIHAKFFNNNKISPDTVSMNLINTFDFEDTDDVSALKYYIENVVKVRATKSELYNTLYSSRKEIK